MRVYERPSHGLSPAALRRLTATDRRGASFAALRVAVGLAMLVLSPVVLWWLFVPAGLVLTSSALLFVRRAAVASVERPALVLTGRPRWDGTTRRSWTIDADDPTAVAARLAAALDLELGESLDARDPADGPAEGTNRSRVLTGEHDGIIAWASSGAPHLRADGDRDGVWLRRDAESGAVILLSSEGRATAALKAAAASIATGPEVDA
ncbi:MAG: hypothetical protein R2698_02800 [Microthrixaceae bacterium]